MGLRPEFENVRSSIQHRVPLPGSSCWCEIRGDSTLAPLLGWVWGSILYYLRVLQIRFLRLNMLRDIDPMVRILNLEAPLVHQANETCPRSPLLQEAGSHDCRLSQAAECKLSSTVRHSSSCCSSGDAYWIGDFPIPLLHRASAALLLWS